MDYKRFSSRRQDTYDGANSVAYKRGDGGGGGGGEDDGEGIYLIGTLGVDCIFVVGLALLPLSEGKERLGSDRILCHINYNHVYYLLHDIT